MTAAESPESLLAALADTAKCTPLLSERVRAFLVQPFLDSSTITSISTKSTTAKRTTSKATAMKMKSNADGEAKKLTTQLAPLAMRIINQNLQTMSRVLASSPDPRDNSSTMALEGRPQALIQCLVDTSFHSVAALQCMELYLAIKRLDIEKAMSNVITKTIELGMSRFWNDIHDRALQELSCLRKRLVKLVTPSALPVENLRELETKSARTSKSTTKSSTTASKTTISKAVPAAPVPSGSRQLTTRIKDPHKGVNAGDSICDKYKPLFSFPLEAELTDQATLLLILACQLNALRCWLELEKGTFIKYVPFLLDQQGNPHDWCLRLREMDKTVAVKQFDAFYRVLNKAATNVQVFYDDGPAHALDLRSRALVLAVDSGAHNVATICDQFLKTCVMFERSLMPLIIPNVDNSEECGKVLALCEYLATNACKANDFDVAIETLESFSLKIMPIGGGTGNTMSLRTLLQSSFAQLSIVSVILDRILLDGRGTDDISRMERAAASMHFLIKALKPTDDILSPIVLTATTKLLKGIDLLRRSCTNVLDGMEKKSELQAKQEKQDIFKTPKAPSKRAKPEVDESRWLDVSPVVMELLAFGVDFAELILRKRGGQYKNTSQADTHFNAQKTSLIAIDALTLLSRMTFDIDDESSQSKAEAYLKRADRICGVTESWDGWRWVSGAYYNIGGALYKQSLFKRAISSLSRSCDLLAKYVGHTQKFKSSAIGLEGDLDESRSQLCKRFEILAISFQKIGGVEDAKRVLERAISCLPLAKIEYFAMHLDQEPAAVAAQRLPALPKLIDRYLRLAIMDASLLDGFKYPHAILANQDLPLTGMGGIMEYELGVLKSLSHKVDLGDRQMEIVDSLLELYNAQSYPIRRARILLEKVKLVRSGSKYIERDSRFARLLAEKSVELLKTENYGDDSELLKLRKHYLALAYSWIGICCHEACESATKKFRMALQLWKSVLRIPPICSGGQPSNETIANTRAQVDDVERLFGHLHFLADFFGVVDQPINQILTLRLMLRVNNGLRYTCEENHADSICAYTTIGHAYVGLGYTGKAGLAFSQAKLLLEGSSCPDKARLQWMLGYSHYLCSIGNSDKSEQIFNDTKKIADARNSVSNGKTSSKLSQTRAQENILLADASLTRSDIALRMGLLDKAIEDATKSLRLLKRVTSSLIRRARQILDQPDKLPNPFLVDSEQGAEDVVLADKENQSTVDSVVELAMQQSQWDVAKVRRDLCLILSSLDIVKARSTYLYIHTLFHTTQRLLDCFSRLGNLYIIRGSAREAEYFFNQGLALARSINASATVSRFLASLAELEYRRYRWEESELNLKQAVDCQGKENLFAREQADLKIRAGDLDLRQEIYDQALLFYDDAEGILTAMMDETFILSLENVQSSDDQTPRETRLAKFPGTPTAPATPRKLEDGVEFECYVLDYMKSEVFCRKGECHYQTWFCYCLLPLCDLMFGGIFGILSGWILSKQGKLPEARELLNRLAVIRPQSSNEVEYHFTSAKIMMLGVLEELSRHPIFGMIQDSVLLSPQLGNFSTEKIVRNSKKGGQRSSQELQRDIEVTLRHLTDAYNKGFCCANSQLIYETCMTLVFTHMMKACCFDADKLDTNRVAIISAYYLEMSKGVSIRREMISCLEEKLRVKSSCDDLIWPKGFLDDDANSENSWSSDSSSEANPEWHREHLNELLQAYNHEGIADETAFRKQFIDILPPHWIACSISIDIEKGDMYIVRMRVSEVPIVLRLPLKRQATREGEEGFGYTDALEELSAILENSNETTQVGKNCKTRDEKLAWWKTRKELDDRMKDLLESIQSTWLGGFKGALSADCVIDTKALEKFKATIELLALKAASSRTSSKPKMLEVDREMCKIFVQLGSSPDSDDLEDVVYFLLDAYQYNGVAIAYDEIDIDQITDDFKDALAEYHHNLKDCITDNVARHPQHVILILDKNSQMLPWESLPILRQQPVSRLPSLSFLRDRILFANAAHLAQGARESSHWRDYRIDQRKTSYVLNPSQDLKNTQVEFEVYLGRFDDWGGIVGRAPSGMECENALKNQDLYIYFGHSGGEQYIRGYQVRQLDRCAVTLLMGCSSGCLKPAGEFDPYGNALNYIMAGWLVIRVNCAN
ncbi:peptidase family C50-domain-containing protein [Jimgerdemannia flammicorona]|uniref:separase n=1 Tax=Jimgerdemannia flammicorona TaxID=994334 RepID=A0A433QGS4_9FUNG|nr:peptidase family C50-domain-containing protein [Jimgerdemannia flammicorona]